MGTSIISTAIRAVLVLPTLTNDSCPGVFLSTSLPSDFLSLVSVSDLDICKAIKPL